MKTSTRTAILKALKALGLNDSDFAHPSWSPSGVAICTEGDHPYLIGDSDEYTVNADIQRIAAKHGCFVEWENPAILCITPM